MGLGERCDEIVRLIDETLAAFGIDPLEPSPGGAVPASGGATVTPLPPSGPAAPDRAASGF